MGQVFSFIGYPVEQPDLEIFPEYFSQQAQSYGWNGIRVFFNAGINQKKFLHWAVPFKLSGS